MPGNDYATLIVFLLVIFLGWLTITIRLVLKMLGLFD